MRTRHSRWRCSAMLPLLLSACDGADTPGPEADSASETGDLTGGDAADLPSEADPEPYDGDPALEDLSPDQPDAPMLPNCPETSPLPEWATVDGATLRVAAPEFTLVLAPLENGALYLHYLATGEVADDRSWAVLEQPPPDAGSAVVGTPGGVALCTALLRVEVNEAALITVRDADGAVLLEDGAAGGWRRESVERDGITRDTTVLARHTPAGEVFYGFGEHTGALDRRGRLLTFWNTDAYDPELGGWQPDADPLYLGVPFYLARREGRTYGVFTDNTYRMEADVAAADGETLVLRAFGGQLRQYVIPGPTAAAVLDRYTALTGRPALPPRWALGFHQSRWGYSPDDAFEAIGAQFRARGIPADALWLDIQHLDRFRTFTFDPVTLDDPVGLLSRLRQQGFRVVVIADPGIAAAEGWDVYESGLEADVFLRRPNGQIYEGIVWPGVSSWPDFTEARARDWWAELVGGRVELGVGGIWLDVNEPTTFPESGGGNTIPDDVRCGGDGQPTTLAECHNVYALEQARATWEGLLAAAPGQRPFILSRAGYAGIQRYAAVWTGDAPSTWDSLQGTLPMLLGLGVSGIPFVGSDVGGYSGRAGAELYARWMALGAVSPFFRAHLTSNQLPQEPWRFGVEVEDISRELISWRYEMLPYLYSLFSESARTGAPVLRPLAWEFPGEPALARVDDAALLGPWLLVAPVLEEGATRRDVALPPGRWFELLSGAIYDGPAPLTTDVTLAALPRYVREGAILPRGPRMPHSEAAPLSPLFLDVYPAAAETTFDYYEDAGADSALTRYRLVRTPSGARLTAEARQGAFEPIPRALVVRLRRADSAPDGVSLNSEALAEQPDETALVEAGLGWRWDSADRSIQVAVPDEAPFELDFFYDAAIDEPRPPVPVVFQVTVPADTPLDPPIHIALSSNEWAHVPLAWSEDLPNTAVGVLEVPRGEWFYYKYTRGGWETVEKWPDCVEATNRYGFGAAHPVRQDQVFDWRDWCEP